MEGRRIGKIQVHNIVIFGYKLRPVRNGVSCDVALYSLQFLVVTAVSLYRFK
jgi:hypothetical protein